MPIALRHKAYEKNPRSASNSIPGVSRTSISCAGAGSERVQGPMVAWRVACVPHSANATSRACGNAACSPLFTSGRPKNSSFCGVSATSRQVPSIATSRRPAMNDPDVPGHASGTAARANNAAPAPARAGPRLKDRRPARAARRTPASPRPTTRPSAAPGHPRTSPPRTGPCRSRSTSSTVTATPDAGKVTDRRYERHTNVEFLAFLKVAKARSRRAGLRLERPL